MRNKSFFLFTSLIYWGLSYAKKDYHFTAPIAPSVISLVGLLPQQIQSPIAPGNVEPKIGEEVEAPSPPEPETLAPVVDMAEEPDEDENAVPEENDEEPDDNAEVTEAPIDSPDEPDVGGDDDNDEDDGNTDDPVESAPGDDEPADGGDDDNEEPSDDTVDATTDAPMESSPGDDKPADDGVDDNGEPSDDSADATTDAPVESSPGGDEITDVPVEDSGDEPGDEPPEYNSNGSGNEDPTEAPITGFILPGENPSGGDVVGASYCTYSPDFSCFADGWPSCCDDEFVECPSERPLCDGDGGDELVNGGDNGGDEWTNGGDSGADWEDVWRPPSESPVKYVSRDDDILEAEKEENNASWAKNNYETLEQMAHDRNVLIALSTVFGLMILFSVIVAHQMLNNPDGCCASICRVITQCTCCIFSTICFPCAMVCGGNKRRGHTRMMNDSNTYGHDLELT